MRRLMSTPRRRQTPVTAPRGGKKTRERPIVILRSPQGPLAASVVRGETTGDEHFALRGTCFSCGVAIVWAVLERRIPPPKRPLASFECFAPPRPCRAAASQSSAPSSRPNCRRAVWSCGTRPPLGARGSGTFKECQSLVEGISWLKNLLPPTAVWTAPKSRTLQACGLAGPLGSAGTQPSTTSKASSNASLPFSRSPFRQPAPSPLQRRTPMTKSPP